MNEYEANQKKLEKMMSSGEINKYLGEHIVFVGGELVDHDKDETALSNRVAQHTEWNQRNRHFYHVPEQEEGKRAFKFRSPRVVRNTRARVSF